MHLDDATLGEILIKNSYVSKDDLARAKEHAEKTDSSAIGFLIEEGTLSKDLLGQALAEHYGVPYVDLNSKMPQRETVLKIPEDIARKFSAALIEEKEKQATVATSDPSQPGLAEALASLLPGRSVVLAYALAEDIETVLRAYQKPLETRFSKIIEKGGRIAPEILEEIFNDSIAFRASDIHFEPQIHGVTVRFRVDGVLHEAGRLRREHYENVLNRVKIQSRMRIDEHFAAQDGSMRHEKEGSALDLRVSIVPTVEGEKIVIRVLASYVRGLSLQDLGLAPHEEEVLSEASGKPYGMILVAGPTGSGKTTTLYALLKLLNRPDVNIMTIEDPVEYKMPGTNQIQVAPQQDLTFARGLRSVVRQDPDVILVGEIRDEETAEIAVNAALTGHLLLSTFHANDAATAIPRLLEMGVEPFLLSSTLELIVAQRLVRTLCESCRVSDPQARGRIAERLPQIAQRFSDQATLYRGKGCPVCGGTGYKGRTAIFEAIRVTPEVQELMLRSPSAAQIRDLASTQGFRPMYEDGIEKVRRGITTMEEVMRVVEMPRDAQALRTPRVKRAARKTGTSASPKRSAANHV